MPLWKIQKRFLLLYPVKISILDIDFKNSGYYTVLMMAAKRLRYVFGFVCFGRYFITKVRYFWLPIPGFTGTFAPVCHFKSDSPVDVTRLQISMPRKSLHASDGNVVVSCVCILVWPSHSARLCPADTVCIAAKCALSRTAHLLAVETYCTSRLTCYTVFNQGHLSITVASVQHLRLRVACSCRYSFSTQSWKQGQMAVFF